MTIIDTRNTNTTTGTLPADSVLEQFRDRAQRADADNTYLHEDLAVLREIGYLAAAVPGRVRWLGPEPRRVRRAPATARDVRAGDRPGDDDAHLLDRHRRRARAIR